MRGCLQKKGHQKKFWKIRLKKVSSELKSNKFITWPVTGPSHVYSRTAHKFLKFLKARGEIDKNGS